MVSRFVQHYAVLDVTDECLGYLTHVINKDYLRMKVVKGLVKDSSYRESVVSLNLAPWVLQGKITTFFSTLLLNSQ
jgi:hypothetical protein